MTVKTALPKPLRRLWQRFVAMLGRTSVGQRVKCVFVVWAINVTAEDIKRMYEATLPPELVQYLRLLECADSQPGCMPTQDEMDAIMAMVGDCQLNSAEYKAACRP
ncbi:MAG TPA: hypothetical protein VK502_03095 [Candidatus Saccharimonadales bacterium]|nr:hypothetical protein [Candidatus Saccharimonadales bacterium]